MLTVNDINNLLQSVKKKIFQVINRICFHIIELTILNLCLRDAGVSRWFFLDASPSTSSDEDTERRTWSLPEGGSHRIRAGGGERYTNRWLKFNLVPVTTDFWSVSRRKQVTLRGGVWKHVLSEAYWMIPWCRGGGEEESIHGGHSRYNGQ